MDPGKKKPQTLLSLTIYIREPNTETYRKKMTRFFSLKGTKSTPIFIKPNAKSPLSNPKTK